MKIILIIITKHEVRATIVLPYPKNGSYVRYISKFVILPIPTITHGRQPIVRSRIQNR